MKGKKLLYTVVALVVVVLAIVISDKLSKKAPSESSLKFFPELKESNISAFTIKESNTSVKVRKKGDVWVVSPVDSSQKVTASPLGTDASPSVGEYPADSASVAAVLEKIAGMKKGELISENPAKQTLFEVDSAKGILVEVFDGTGSSRGSFRIGKSGADWSSNYVRMVNSNSVYMVGGSIRYAFFSDLKRWRDKIIIKFDQSAAKRITLIKKDGSSVAVTKADTGNGWNIVEPVKSTAKVDQINEILGTISRFTALDFEDSTLSDSEMGFNAPELSVVVGFSNDLTKKFVVGTKNSSSNYYVKTDEKPSTVFLVAEYEIDRINKGLKDLDENPSVEETKPDTKKAGKKKK
ncbi:MAG: DUF4340 domain-containing protein [Fibrobacter sp.]|nr:DUF4340 domain-containing protein [Fibrobacter sp.]